MNRWLCHQMLVSPHVGGGAKLALDIHRRTVRSRGRVSRILVPASGTAERAARNLEDEYFTYDLGRLTHKRRLISLAENARIFMKLSGTRSGVIHIHAPHVYGAARPFLQATQLKTVLHIHLDFSPEQLRWSLKRRPDLIVLCAEYMRGAVEQALAAVGHSTANLKVFRNAIDIALFQPADRLRARAALGLDGREINKLPLLLVVANLAPHKGQETAIRAVAILRERGHNVRLWLAGIERDEGGGYLTHLKSLCAELGIQSSVEFLGFRDDVPQLLQAADFLLLPSTSEGLPLVVLEAQSAKTLVLAAPTAGIPEVVRNGETGFLAGAHDAAAYADRIADMLRYPQRREAIIECASKYVRLNHDFDSYSARMLDEYDALVRE